MKDNYLKQMWILSKRLHEDLNLLLAVCLVQTRCVSSVITSFVIELYKKDTKLIRFHETKLIKKCRIGLHRSYFREE